MSEPGSLAPFRLRRPVIALCLALAVFAQARLAFACRPMIQTVAEYRQHRIPNGAVFLGEVRSVRTRQTTDDSVVLDIEFRVSRWFEGVTQDSVLVRGLISRKFVTDCHGVFDFSARPGEQWLIFGQVSDGRVLPDNRLSVKVQGGKVPPSLLKQLE